MGIKINWSPRVIGDSQNVYRSEQPFDQFNLPGIFDTVGAEVSVYDDALSTEGVNYYYAIETIYGDRSVLSKIVSEVGGASAPPPPPPSTPVVESYQDNVGFSNPVVCIKPTGVEVGDLLLLIVGNDYHLGGVEFNNNVSGWERLVQAGSGGTTDVHLGIYWRIADGTEGATQNIVTTHSRDWFSNYLRISGANTIAPFNAVATQFDLGSAMEIPAITTDVDLCLLLIGLSFDRAEGVPFSTPTEGYSITDSQSINGDAGISGCWGQKNQETAGTTIVTVIQAANVSGAVTFQLAVAPID